MNKIRVRFIRGEEVKFIGHLDIMKVFERAIRRSGLPIAYSLGFNPHPQMVFGLPLPVGVTSDDEYGDFEMEVKTEPEKFMETLNKSLPDGLKVIAASEKNTKMNIMAAIAAADYEMEIFLNESLSCVEMNEKIKRLMEQERIEVMKESKKSLKETDIRPLILNVSVEDIRERPGGYEEFISALKLTGRFKAGNVGNLRPELFLKALGEHEGISVDVSRIHRKALYVEKNSVLLNPLDSSVLNDAVTTV